MTALTEEEQKKYSRLNATRRAAGQLADIRGGPIRPPASVEQRTESVGNQETDKVTPPTVTNKKLVARAKTTQSKEILRYPNQEIEKDVDYLKIQILEYVPLKFNAADGSSILKEGLRSSKGLYKNKNALSTIILPIPQNITSTNGTGWGEDSLNTLAAYAVGKSQEVINSDNFFKGLFDAIRSTAVDVEGLAVSGQGQQLTNTYFSSLAANALGANTTFGGVLARSTGQILNPNTELLFNGVKLRSFNFSFDLAPRNRTEAEKVKLIIREFKRNMAPPVADFSATVNGESRSSRGLFLKSPNVFQLTYMTGANKHQFLNSFIIAALTNINVNYTGSGTYMTYDDSSKTPVHMKMDLSFQELSPVYREDYDENDGLTGVGY